MLRPILPQAPWRHQNGLVFGGVGKRHNTPGQFLNVSSVLYRPQWQQYLFMLPHRMHPTL